MVVCVLTDQVQDEGESQLFYLYDIEGLQWGVVSFVDEKRCFLSPSCFHLLFISVKWTAVFTLIFKSCEIYDNVTSAETHSTSCVKEAFS